MVDPLGPQLTGILNRIQALPLGELPAKEAALLTALLGQELEGVLEALGPEGVRIRFGQGTVISAKGELPYPVGTQLRVRVSPSPTEAGGVRLETLSARPPRPPEVLAPLLFGEAMPLLNRLFQADGEPGLQPLQTLMRQLLPDPALASSSSASTLTELVASLPRSQAQALAQALGSAGAPEADGLSRILQTLMPRPDALEAEAQQPRRPGGGVETPSATQPEATLARFQALLARQPDLAPATREALLAWFRNTLAKPKPGTPETPKGSRPEGGQGKPPEAGYARPTGREQVQTQAQSAPKAPVQDRLQEPASWEAWLREGLQALGDPEISPREAPFHLAQAQERTALFELPLPWMPGNHLQLWVEWDKAMEDPEALGQGTARVLLSLRFSRLGETRLGLTSSPGRLSVRIWLEHPEQVALDQEALALELAATGRTVDLSIHRLESGTPDLRTLAGGGGWQGMG